MKTHNKLYLLTSMILLASGCLSSEDSGAEVSRASLEVSDGMAFSATVNPTEAEAVTGRSVSWAAMTPCELFKQIQGSPKLYRVDNLVMTNPGERDIAPAVTYARLVNRTDSEWVAFAGGILPNRIHTVSATYGVAKNQQIVWFRDGSEEIHPSLEAYWLKGNELLTVEGGHIQAGPGRIGLPTGSSESAINDSLNTLVASLRASANGRCDRSWTDPEPSESKTPDNSLEVRVPPLEAHGHAPSPNE